MSVKNKIINNIYKWIKVTICKGDSLFKKEVDSINGTPCMLRN